MSDQDEMFDHAVSSCRDHVKPVVKSSTQWRVSPEQRGGGWAIECDSHGVVALAIQRDYRPLSGKEVTWDEARANALKISAVDDLLEALIALRSIEFGHSEADICKVRMNADAAIAKATGTA